MEEQLTQLTGALLLGVAALSYLALRSWRNQALEQGRQLGSLIQKLEHTNSTTLEGFYVATTERDEPLRRIKSAGLGMRGRATVEISASGVSIWRTGEVALHISRESISNVDRATVAIDRVVENGGLSRISWSNAGLLLDTYIRFSSVSSQQIFNTYFNSAIAGQQEQGDLK